MPKVSVNGGVKLHYQQLGEGPDLVMIHGLTGNLAVWHLKILPLLADHFRCLTYDLRGHGYSDMPPTGYTPDDMAEDLLGLLDALGIERAYLVGHSFGADVALYLSLLHPDRVQEVVAIEAAIPATIYLRDRDDWEGWAYWSDLLEKSGFPVPPERRTDVEYLLRLSLQVPKKWGPLAGLPRNADRVVRLIDTTRVVEEAGLVGSLTVEAIPTVTTPVTLLYSESSAFASTQHYLAEHLANAKTVGLPPTEWGHFGPLEQPEVVAQNILDLLGSVKSGRPSPQE
ncbi:MAG: alpha/beta fold hydrolase [Acidimicrobiales bacterium]